MKDPTGWEAELTTVLGAPSGRNSSDCASLYGLLAATTISACLPPTTTGRDTRVMHGAQNPDCNGTHGVCWHLWVLRGTDGFKGSITEH